MTAFYIIHTAVILEIILTIFFAIKISELILKIKNLRILIEKNSEAKLSEIRKIHEKIERLNIKWTKKNSYYFDFAKKIIANFTIQFVLKKSFLSKYNFLNKISAFQSLILGFAATLFFLNKKNA